MMGSHLVGGVSLALVAALFAAKVVDRSSWLRIDFVPGHPTWFTPKQPLKLFPAPSGAVFDAILLVVGILLDLKNIVDLWARVKFQLVAVLSLILLTIVYQIVLIGCNFWLYYGYLRCAIGRGGVYPVKFGILLKKKVAIETPMKLFLPLALQTVGNPSVANVFMILFSFLLGVKSMAEHVVRMHLGTSSVNNIWQHAASATVSTAHVTAFLLYAMLSLMGEFAVFALLAHWASPAIALVSVLPVIFVVAWTWPTQLVTPMEQWWKYLLKFLIDMALRILQPLHFLAPGGSHGHSVFGLMLETQEGLELLAPRSPIPVYLVQTMWMIGACVACVTMIPQDISDCLSTCLSGVSCHQDGAEIFTLSLALMATVGLAAFLLGTIGIMVACQNYARNGNTDILPGFRSQIEDKLAELEEWCRRADTAWQIPGVLEDARVRPLLQDARLGAAAAQEAPSSAVADPRVAPIERYAVAQALRVVGNKDASLGKANLSVNQPDPCVAPIERYAVAQALRVVGNKDASLGKANLSVNQRACLDLANKYQMAVPASIAESSAEPSNGLRDRICYSWTNLLLLLLPISIAAKHNKLEATAFWLNVVALIPLSKLFGDFQEDLAGNLKNDLLCCLVMVTSSVEIILALVFMSNRQYDILKAFIIGSVFCRILLCLGLSFFIGDLKASKHGRRLQDAGNSTESEISLGDRTIKNAVVVLLTLIAWSMLSLVTGSIKEQTHWQPQQSIEMAHAISILMILLYLAHWCVLHPRYFQEEEEYEEEEEEPLLSFRGAAGLLALITGLVVVCSQYLSNNLEQALKSSPIPLTVDSIGLLLPIVCQFSGIGSAILFACSERVKFSVAISISPSLSDACWLLPVTVLAGWAAHPGDYACNMDLNFDRVHVASLICSGLLVLVLIVFKMMNVFGGCLLLTFYFITAGCSFFMHFSHGMEPCAASTK